MWRGKWGVVGAVAGMVLALSALAIQREGPTFQYAGTRLRVDLTQPDAVVRTQSLARLPRDMLQVPLLHDLLSEDWAFYYQQHEDRLALGGFIKRIAYERKLDWSESLLLSALNEPAEVAFWRDGKGALRHYALMLRRNFVSRLMQQMAALGLQDVQLQRVLDMETGNGVAPVYALKLHPRRILLLISQGDRLVLLSDPGLLLDSNQRVVATSQAALLSWLHDDNSLSKKFSLVDAGRSTHTLAIGASALSLGYADLMSGFKGLRFDFGGGWSTAAWLDGGGGRLGDAALWQVAPVNPAACLVLPVEWRTVKRVVNEAEKKPPSAHALLALDGPALACWYADSKLYSPVFMARLAQALPNRAKALSDLADWALKGEGSVQGGQAANVSVWRGKQQAALAVSGQWVAFSPDGALVDKVLDTVAHTLPSVADQADTSNRTLAVLTPQSLSGMAEREMLQALNGEGSLLTVAQSQLPTRLRTLNRYPPYLLELQGNGRSGWQSVGWLSKEAAKP